MKPLIYYHGWRYKNTALLVVSLAALFLASQFFFAQQLVNFLQQLNYFGAFITGIFFTSMFTVAPATVVLYLIAQNHNPLLIAIFGGLGTMLGDYIIFRFLKDRVFDEFASVVAKIGGSHLRQLLHTPYFAWLLPVLGAIIIASPLPDELGITLMGLGKIKNWQFLTLSFVLNSSGILIIASLAHV
ncbi:MAG: hypothetical protein A3E98_00865 [Candidatus Doudnabacteria bacterium RIFCSPHIGHO2_12_FULL_48_11]|uniref:TVP38/TMEM64 family membrane protein n=1 Tax=Candidatus Doudnabacteria bacterium RIFCSPHIGHO2_01_FULL_46_24 TaxID=1817825 RepID=A0A1F5NWF6_9BACT|nr:MAG: hypothetical protein A2720_01855 [Candidatus Doudnabacteria bacterium RIFCSPHIGHO2_01_FULL_46_24]OGE95377.1 MAG: hypothetical protein A3E98_00865 [Candidatus Doudnabacteria bacterium RIFCSPHIGHO2_12_FULL_48_11]